MSRFVDTASPWPFSASWPDAPLAGRHGVGIRGIAVQERGCSLQRMTSSAADSNTEMARKRTVLAADRTLMAWIRTALSMISFGFTIAKFLHGLQEASAIRLRRPESPRAMGLFLAALGTASVLIGLVEYVRVVRNLGGHSLRLGLTAYVAAAVLALGVLVCFGLLTRLGPF